MTIKVCGSSIDREYPCAINLKEKLEKDPKLISSENEIYIYPSVQCYGQDPQDIDLVVFGNLKNYSANVKCRVRKFDDDIKERTISIKNFCLVIEVKKHSLDRIKFEGSHLMTKRPGDIDYFSASNQNDGQIYSLRKFIKSKGFNPPFMGNIIYLPIISSKQIPPENNTMNIIFSDFSISDFWNQSIRRSAAIYKNSEFIYQSLDQDLFEKSLPEYLKLLNNRMDFSRLDREKIEAICKKEIKDQKYKDEFGEQLLIFRGRGGTGKTYRLLNLAKYLYDNFDARVLLLTYNKALVSDILRLFAILRIPPNSIEGSIIIKSLHNFWYSIFFKVGLLDESEEFEYYKKALNNLLDYGTINKRDSSLFNYDYVMIDEAQDWPEDERDLIYKIFGSNKIIIADGMDQLIRGSTPCKWKASPLCKESKPIHLRKGFRQKANLTRFVKEFASKSNIDYDVEIDIDKYGGNVIIIEGQYTIELHNRLIEQNRDNKNKNIDMLFCVPPKYKSIEIVENNSLYLQETFLKWGFSIWDGVNEKTRDTYPTELEQLRIIQYDSCRGLEGWICVNIAFDTFYKYKNDTYKEQKEGQFNFMTEEEKKKLFADNWCLIPLTRAMDTIVLHIENPDSYIAKILKDIYNNNKEYIEWISN